MNPAIEEPINATNIIILKTAHAWIDLLSILVITSNIPYGWIKTSLLHALALQHTRAVHYIPQMTIHSSVTMDIMNNGRKTGNRPIMYSFTVIFFSTRLPRLVLPDGLNISKLEYTIDA